MTPDLEKELIVGIFSVLFTALFAGIPGIALFWWTWQRDQERLIVQKLLYRSVDLKGSEVLEQDLVGPTFGIVIRNRSLFPVHVSSVGFKIDGEVIELDSALYETRMMRNPDGRSPYVNIPDGSDPKEIPSQASTRVSVRDDDRPKIAEALLRAANKRGVSIEDLLFSPKVAALVATETGKQFTSTPLLNRIKFELKKALVAPE